MNSNYTISGVFTIKNFFIKKNLFLYKTRSGPRFIVVKLSCGFKLNRS